MKRRIPIAMLALLLGTALIPHLLAQDKKIDTVPAKESSAGQKPAANGKAAASDEDEGKAANNFRGKISAVDKAAKTFSIEGKKKMRVFHVSDDTKIMKGDAPGTWTDIVEGEEVRGSAMKGGPGPRHALTVSVGPQAGGRSGAAPGAKTPKVKDPATIKTDKTEPAPNP